MWRSALHELAVGQEITVRLAESCIRVPDVAAFERRPDRGLVEMVPVLVAEVLSPSTRTEDLLRKAPEYLAAGVGQYWVVDPDARRIEVYRNDGDTWNELVVVTQASPNATVEVAEHGTVAFSLADVLPAHEPPAGA